MRQALNNNPMVQIAVIGVLIVVAGLFFMMSKGGSSSSPSSSGSATAGTAGAAGTTTPVTVGGSSSSAPSTGAPTGGVSLPSTGQPVTPASLIPGPGLPQPVVKAYKSGDAVVLLIVRGGGIDDRLVRDSVRQLSGDPGVAVFVARAKDVARYSRITQPAGVDRAPALVVVRPRKESGAVPQATVSYGFRDSQSVVQAVHNALYSGPDDLPYSPR
jgi:hypothetical protein